MIIIKPKEKFSFSDLKEIWQYKELLYFFTWRDLKVRYKQTVIGVAWVIFQPFISMVVFTVFFGTLAKMPSDGIPYPIFVYSGLLFWTFFSSALADVSDCLISNKGIITKVYFPRLILPIASCLTRLVDFAVAAVILIGLMFYYHYVPSLLGLVMIPVLCLIAFVAALGLGLFLASVNIKYRDVRYILPFFIQMLLFVTPVIYPPSLAGKYSWILAFNPMTGVIKSARTLLFNDYSMNWLQLGISTAVCVIILAFGLYYFRKTERYSADII